MSFLRCLEVCVGKKCPRHL